MSPEVQAAILRDADADPTIGYRRLAKLHDQPVDTVRDLVRAHRAGRTPKPRAPARAREPAPTPPASSDPPFDPATATERQFLEHELRVAVRRAETSRNEGVARQWAETAASRRAELDALDRREREEAEWQRRAEVVDPTELCRQVTALLPVLARTLPRDEYDAFIAAAQAARPREE